MRSEGDELPIGFGLPNEWQAFIGNNHALVQKLRILFGTLNKVFIRTQRRSSPAGIIVFYLGRLCAEDLMEILLLCGNGYGVGGLKLLRSMYEKAITAAYIAQNPDQAEAFIDYGHIHERKALNHLKNTFSQDDFRQLIPDNKVKEIQEAADKVKGQFQEPLCKTCNTTKDQMSWSKMGMPAMANAVGDGFKELYFPCYYRPTLQAHPTVSAMVERLELKDDGGMTFKEGSQRDTAREAMILAHHLILLVINTQNKYFDLKLEDEINQRIADFQEVWNSN